MQISYNAIDLFLILLQNKHKTISKFIIDKKIQNEQVVCQAKLYRKLSLLSINT